MEDTDVHLLLKYPLMKKFLKGTTSVYKGSINVKENDYALHIEARPDDSIRCELPEDLKSFEAKFFSVLNNLESLNIVVYLDVLCSLIEQYMSLKTPENLCDIYSHVLYEYSEFTKFYLNLKNFYLSGDLSRVNISILDEQNREHCVQIKVNYDGRFIFEIMEYDLPEYKEIFKSSSSLRAVFDQFMAVVEELQPFFIFLNLLDQNCWILDPVDVKRRHNYRRIWLANNLSVIITIDPHRVTQIPDIKFLGPEKLVEIYRSTVNNNIAEWNAENNIVLEILKLIGMDKFPERNSKEVEREVLFHHGDCSICFSLMLNDKIPQIVCKNKFCENNYHVECLHEWLISVNAKKVFTQIIGQCPNCDKSISCPILA